MGSSLAFRKRLKSAGDHPPDRSAGHCPATKATRNERAKGVCATIASTLVLLMSLACCHAAPPSSHPPNVLFIAVDDLNDWVGFMGGYPGRVHTPNIDKLAGRGVAFTNAHCASPVCCSSRTAVLTGLMPQSSGVYNNGHWWRPHRPGLVTIPMRFKAHGYHVVGAGKIFHHTAGSNPPDQWDEFQRLAFNDDPWFRGHELNYPWSKVEPFPEGFPFSKVPQLPHENDWGALPNRDESDYDDARTVDFAIRQLARRRDKPFFLACGLFRPHLPWYAPKKYFDRHPLHSIQLPVNRPFDLNDVPKEAQNLAKARRSDLEKIRQADRYRHAVQAYLASISFADAQVGRLLKALDDSPHAANTIIVFWSDHGWHHGQKEHWHKSTLWEEATRVPFIVVAPGAAGNGSTCAQPVSLVDIYPTLIDLCGLPPVPDLDGLSLAPQLDDPTRPRPRPAITVFKPGQASVRSLHHRYTRYSDGAEELYDHRSDPNEWNNRAGRREDRAIIEDLSRWLPKNWAEPAPKKGAYEFDPGAYSWMRKSDGARFRDATPRKP